MRTARLFPGDLVEVKPELEILRTLDGDGTLNQLPFMPEMMEFCGRRFHVVRRVVKTCVSGSGSSMRTFRADDVVLLDGLRCSGAAHDGCQKACMIFWREAWLRKIGDGVVPARFDAESSGLLGARLKTLTDFKTYFCQASELLKATDPLSRWERLGKCLSDIRSGNSTILEMGHAIGVWLFWRARRLLLGEYARGSKKSTPSESLNLQPGEWIKVKPMARIRETLNEDARNRGLYFSPDMRFQCGRKRQVERRIEKIVVDGTGEMRQLRNTVYLHGSLCGCAHVAFGGCSRCELSYWREIWLTRDDDSGCTSKGV